MMYEEGKQFYQEHKEELESKYWGQYIAIWKGRIISRGNNFSEVALRAYDKVGYHDMYMPKVGFTERVYRFPSVRLNKPIKEGDTFGD